MSSETTNIKPDDLNYDHYETETYDSDIVASIPGHTALHEAIADEVKRYAAHSRLNRRPS